MIKSIKTSTIKNNIWYKSMLVGNNAFLNVTIEYLVIAGGGGGGRGTQGDGAVGGGGNGGGGGGAGGYRSSVISNSSGGASSAESLATVELGATYSVVIGAGGSGSATWNVQGGLGSESTFSNITSLGGGGGTSNRGHLSLGPLVGSPGGSGGGSWGYHDAVALGTTGQGTNGGKPTPSGSNSGGGGGSATAAEIFSNTQNYGRGGSGGSGTASTITGSSVTRGGGGGGGAYTGAGGSFSGGSGGSGGGGAGAGGTSGSPTAGQVNTGSGGGGGRGGDNYSSAGASGGSGVVILRYPASFTITVGAGLTGSTATVGANKVTTITQGTGNVSWA